MKKGMSYGLGMLVGTLVILPLIYLCLNAFVLPKNKDADKYVNQYLENSRIIEVPAIGEYSEKSKTYADKLQVKKNRGNVTLFQYTFYSSIHRKYFAIMTFEGDFGIDNTTIKTRERYFDYGTVYKAYNRNMVIVAAVNNQQWNNPDYGTEKNPLPIFGVDLLESGTKMEQAYNVKEVTNHKFVEQYLKHFMPRKEFKKMFLDK